MIVGLPNVNSLLNWPCYITVTLDLNEFWFATVLCNYRFSQHNSLLLHNGYGVNVKMHTSKLPINARKCTIHSSNIVQYEETICFNTYFSDSTSMYKFSSDLIKCHLFIRHGVQSPLCSATRAPKLSFKYAKCSTMYLAAEIIIQQSCPNKSPLLLDNPIQQSTIWNMFIWIMQHYANCYFYSYWWYIKTRSPAVAGMTAACR